MRTALLFIFLFLFSALPDAQADPLHRYAVDSLQRRVALQKEDTLKVILLHRVAYHQFWLDTSAAQAINQQARTLSEKLDYKRGIFRSIFNRGHFAECSKNYPGALHFYSEARDFAEKNGFYPETHEASTGLLNMHFYRGEYVSALAVCLHGLELAEKKNDIHREANYHNLLGFIHRNMGNNAASEKSYRDYLELAERSGDSLLVASAYMEMAEVYTGKLQCDSALNFLFKAFDLYSGNNERHRRAYIYYLASKAYKADGQPDSAYRYVMEAIDYSRKVPANKYDVARYYIAAGELLVLEKNYPAAIAMLDTGLAIAQEILHHENIRDAYRYLSDAYAGLGNFDKAYTFQAKYTVLKDSLLNEKNLRTIAEMQALYAVEKKDREITFLEQRTALRDAEIRQENRVRNLFLGIIALLLLTGFLFYNRYRLRQKNAYQRTINRQQNEMLQEVVSAQEKERKRIAENLHDGLGSVLSAAKLQLKLMNEEKLSLSREQQQRYDAAFSLISHASEELRTISHAIMPASLAKLGLPAALENIIAGLGQATGMRFAFHAHDFGERPEESVELAIYHITMELVNNIVKHSGATEAVVQLVRHPGYINLTVEDNGKGFNLRERGNGIGLANIESRVEFLGGRMEVDSGAGSGTTVSIDIPIR